MKYLFAVLILAISMFLLFMIFKIFCLELYDFIQWIKGKRNR